MNVEDRKEAQLHTHILYKLYGDQCKGGRKNYFDTIYMYIYDYILEQFKTVYIYIYIRRITVIQFKENIYIRYIH